MSRRIGIGEMRIARAPELLVVYGLGSCLGIVLYAPATRLGGMAHTLLPAFRPGLPDTKMTKYVDCAIRQMTDDLVAEGAARDDLQAKIVGGANMFQAQVLSPADAIGNRNIEAAKSVLEELNIPLVAEDVGGHCGRTMEFNLENGTVSVRSVRDGDNIKTL